MRCFWHTCTCFFFLGGEFIFDWLEFVELFTFLALATLFLPCWVIHVRGSIFCASCFKLLIDLCF